MIGMDSEDDPLTNGREVGIEKAQQRSSLTDVLATVSIVDQISKYHIQLMYCVYIMQIETPRTESPYGHLWGPSSQERSRNQI